MYSIVEDEDLRKMLNGRLLHRVTIVVDTVEDIPQSNIPEDDPETVWAPGSMCMVTATHDYKMLNNQGEWV